MRASLRYVLVGMLIGAAGMVLVIALLLSPATGQASPLRSVMSLLASPTAVVPSATPIPPTPTPSPPPTLTPTATSTPTPTATLTAPQRMIQEGKMLVVGPLTQETQIVRLYEAATRYIAPSSTESRALGEMINGSGYGSPSLICGPLSIAILRDAGLIAGDVLPHDFWLLNPKIAADRAILDDAFPVERFEHLVNKNPLSKIDWLSTPLLPGDFVYLEEGTGGNFDHMLVVSRVDADQRVYAVTNYQTPDGFVVNEALLYDPVDSGAGLFGRWTEQPNAVLGSTGFGGFELWRIRAG